MRFKEFCEKRSETLMKMIYDSNIENYQRNSNFYVGICPTTSRRSILQENLLFYGGLLEFVYQVSALLAFYSPSFSQLLETHHEPNSI
jgi:hypothetical protein